MKSSFIPIVVGLAVVTLSPVVAKPAAAQLGAGAAASAYAHIDSFQNNGSLTAVSYLQYQATNGLVDSPNASVSANSGLKPSDSLSGTSFAKLTNNTSSTVSLSSPATVHFYVGGDVTNVRCSSSASLSLAVGASGNSDDDGTPYYKENTQTFIISAMLPNDEVSASGTFALSATAIR